MSCEVLKNRFSKPVFLHVLQSKTGLVICQRKSHARRHKLVKICSRGAVGRRRVGALRPGRHTRRGRTPALAGFNLRDHQMAQCPPVATKCPTGTPAAWRFSINRPHSRNTTEMSIFAPMQHYTLGHTDLRVSPIGLGCWQFSRGEGMVGRYWSTLSQDTVRDIVSVSLENGITWFDTAEVYGKGASERSLAEALDELGVDRERYVLADKWFPAFRFAGSVTKTFPAREQALGGRRIDLHQIHQPFSFSRVPRQASAMAELVREGKIRAVGVSNFDEKKMRSAHAQLASEGIPLATNQMPYSLIDRKIERNGVLDAAKELGVSIIAYSPLAQGILTGKFHADVDIRRSAGPRKYMKRFKPRGLEATRPLIELLTRTGEAHNASPAQIALAWTVQRHGTHIVAIPGASSTNQATSNAEALNITLSATELEDLAAAGAEAEAKL